MPLHHKVEDAVALLAVLVQTDRIELAKDADPRAIATRFAQWTLDATDSGDADDDVERVGENMLGWFVEQDEVLEIFASPAELLAARAELAWARMPTGVVAGRGRRPSFAALAEATSAVFQWFIDLTDGAAGPEPDSLDRERLLVVAQGEAFVALVGRAGVDPLIEDPYGPIQPESTQVSLDPRQYGERGESAIDPTLEEALDVLLVAARLPAVAPRLAATHASRPFEVRVYADNAASSADPSIVLDLFGALPQAAPLAHGLRRRS